jgi:hypothetical protein
MIKRFLKVISLITIVVFIFGSVNTVFGADTSKAPDSAKNVIYQYASAINNKDWDTLVNLEVSASQTGLKEFLSNPNNQNQGILSVKSAKIKEIKQLPNEAVNDLFNFDDLQAKYGTIYSLLVGIDYKVAQESKYYYNGVQYDVLLIGQDNGKWKIVDGQDAPLEVLVPKGYGFNSGDEQTALNKDGKLLGTNKESYTNTGSEKTINTQINTLSATTAAVTAPSPCPSTIRVYHQLSTSDPYYHKVTTPIFCPNYVEDVVSHEWGLEGYWKMSVLDAGALAVKTFGWYRTMHPNTNLKQIAADVFDDTNDQTYAENYHTSFPNCTAAVEQDERYVGLMNSAGQVWLTQYRTGTQGQIGTYHGGIMYQYGSQVLATTNGYYCTDILNYYYAYSSASSGPIQTFYCGPN